MAVDYLRPFLSHTNMLDIKEEGLSAESMSQNKTIHSGQFMVTRVHEPNVDDDEEEVASPFSDDNKGFDFLNNAVKKTSTTYNFGNAIDESLTKLFECMTLAYSGTITSPRWKQFRGLHVSQKQRIRLNNLIWREWHMQYIYQKRPLVCQFAMPLSDDIHSKPEAVVLEGKYWKRRLDVVTAEYKKWRRYYKDQAQRLQLLQSFGGMSWQQDTSHLSEMELLERVKDVTFIPCLGPGIKGDTGMVNSNTDLALLQRDIMEMDFSADFFNSLNSQPFSFPNPRELNQLGRSDLIQPGLVQLQPNLEEFMDIDSLQLDLLASRIPGAFNSSFNLTTGGNFLQESQSNVEMPQENDTFLDFFNNTQGASNSGQSSNQMSMSLTQPQAIHQQSQMLSPLAQLTDSNSSMMGPSSQNLAFQLSTSLDNHNNNGGQTGLDHSQTIFGDGNQAFAVLNTVGFGSNNLNNINMGLLNASDQKSIESSGGGGTNLADLMTQIQEAQKNLHQQQFQLQQKRQQQLQQQKQQQQRQQQLLQRQQQQQQQQAQLRLQQARTKALPRLEQSNQQDLLQQLLQQHSQFQQSPSAQSPLLAQSLTTSPSASPLHNFTDNGLNNTPPINRTNSQGINALSTSTSPGTSYSVASPQQKIKKGGRQVRGGPKQSPVRKNSGGGGASGVMSDLPKMAAGKKKDGPFTVPQAKPVANTRVNRKIAPAPVPISAPAPVPIAPYIPSIPQSQVTVSPSGPTTSASQESYLAKLLKNGTYPGAMINVKKESPLQKHLTTQQHLLPQGAAGQPSPIQTTTNLYQQIQASAPSPPAAATTIVCRMGSQPGSDTLLSVPISRRIQGSPVFAGKSVGSLGLGQLTPPTLANIVLPVTMGGQQMEGLSSSPADNQQQSFARLSEEKAPSLPSSPNTLGVASPPAFNIKPSPSPPQMSMDTSSGIADPSSPFSIVAMSPSNVGDPTSPATSEIDLMPDSRRAAHLSAEQKRRWNLKTGFDMLQQLVPSLSQNPRVSKATMLQKTAEYCKKLKAERLQMQKEATILKREIESLNASISAVQAQLPETGVPMTRQRKDQMREMFDDYICQRTKENWRFWIFSAIMNPLYDSYCSSVSTASMDELYKTSLIWLDQYCSLVTLRPKVLNSMTKLCTSTSILTEPLKVKEQALQAVEKHPEKHK